MAKCNAKAKAKVNLTVARTIVIRKGEEVTITDTLACSGNITVMVTMSNGGTYGYTNINQFDIL